MNYDEIRKLLGGYTTGTLTAEENQRLMAAAMEDQRIFNALADEEALRELLADPAFRQKLLVELREAKPGLPEKIAAWWRRPLPLALAGSVVMIALAALVLVPMWQQESPVDLAMRQEAPQESLMESEDVVPEMGMRSVSQSENEGSASPSSFDDRLKKEKSAKPAIPAGRGGGSLDPPASPPPSPSAPPERRDLDALVEPKKQAAAQQFKAGAEAYERRRAQETVEADDEALPAGALAYRSTAQTATRGEPMSRNLAAPQVRVEKLTADGVWVTVETGGAARLSDTVRVEVVAPASGYAYLLISDSSDKWQLAAQARVPAGVPAYVPLDGGLPRPSATGERGIAVVFSPQVLATGMASRIAEAERGPAVKTVVRYE
jgi:hypothetical protein